MRTWLLAVVAAACGSKQPALYPAGDTRDDGHGLLAQASTKFVTDEDAEGLLDDNSRRRSYGGSAYGDSAYGGSSYAAYVVPAWPITAPNRSPKYNQVQNLTGAIEGTIALRGSKLPCNADSIKVAAVYIETVQVGRTLMNETRPASVGGTLVKRGCALAPTVQIVTPLPSALAIHGDAKPTTLRIATKSYDLQAGGRVALQLAAGTTKVDLDDGASAWIIAIDTPYYAITDDRGRFRIDELAAGTYEVTIWQPPSGKGEPTITKRTVKVENRRASRLDVR